MTLPNPRALLGRLWCLVLGHDNEAGKVYRSHKGGGVSLEKVYYRDKCLRCGEPTKPLKPQPRERTK